jgi:hypothetical protein
MKWMEKAKDPGLSLIDRGLRRDRGVGIGSSLSGSESFLVKLRGFG